MEGYGLYWFCLEMIAGTVEKHNLTFELQHDSEVIAFATQMNSGKIAEIMRYMTQIGLFENDRGVISCLKMATRTDEYTQKLLNLAKNGPQAGKRESKVVGIVSGQNPDSVGIKSVLREEKRKETKSFDSVRIDFQDFWQVWPKKVNKAKAELAWNRLPLTKQKKAMSDARSRYQSTDWKYIPNPTTYISGERWADETGGQQSGEVYE